MRLLDRYILRQFLPPLVFAFAAMTSIMLLNQVARRFGALVGKGLPWSVIGEVFLLCLPFIIAMTLPMAVLVAMLYTFSHLAADSEITAMRASGVSVLQLLRPMIFAGVLLTGLNFWFTDQILPDSNARLRNLLVNIQRKKPTLELREQVINEIPPSGLFLRASRIDANTGRLRSVTIYDMAGTESRRVIYADSGVMGFTDQGTNLQLRLWDGAIHAFKQTDPALLQVTDFTTNVILVKDVSNRLDLEANDGARGDREMGTCEMMATVREAEQEGAAARQRHAGALERDLRALLGLPPQPAPPLPPAAPLPGYCNVLTRLMGSGETSIDSLDTQRLRDSTEAARAVEDAADLLTLQGVAPRSYPGARPTPRVTSWSEIAANTDEMRTARNRANQFLVEVHKKWAISVACLVFVIVGIPMALRFPRGGMGLVIGGGLAVFAIYYIGLIAGEGLGNKGIVPPWAAMWSPDIIFAALGVYGMFRVARESGSTRGGDLSELWDGITGLVGKLTRWIPRRRKPA
ncbi:MAG TPA: LptF/LptG family permease [Gemmatimonadales bacterium]|nr:LptF/LptG family permease [Gemmatimonadales bacterium]